MTTLLVLVFIAAIIIIMIAIIATIVYEPIADLESSTKKDMDLEFLKWRVRELRRDNQLRHVEKLKIVST